MANLSAAIFLLNDQIRPISVSYEPTDQAKVVPNRVFKSLDPTLVVGDLVVIPTKTRYGFTVAKVDAVDVVVDFDSKEDFGWIVGRVDLSHYERAVQEEGVALKAIAAAEQRKRREDLAKTMFANVDEIRALPISSLSIDGAGA